MNSKTNLEKALTDLQSGKIIIVTDDEGRENEGDFVVAAEKVTPEIVNFMLYHGRGILCISLSAKRCKELHLQMMEPENTSLLGTPFTVSVDLISSAATTGVSAMERAATLRALVNPQTKPEDLARPGHIFPLCAHPEGLSVRQGHTEAVIELMRLAGLKEGGALIEIMNPDGTMARMPELRMLAKKYNLRILTIKELMDSLYPSSWF